MRQEDSDDEVDIEDGVREDSEEEVSMKCEEDSNDLSRKIMQKSKEDKLVNKRTELILDILQKDCQDSKLFKIKNDF